MYETRYVKHLRSSSLKNISEHTKRVYSETSNVMKGFFECSKSYDIETIDKNLKEIILAITYDDCTINSLSKILEHNYYTHTHSVNVSMYAIFLVIF